MTYLIYIPFLIIIAMNILDIIGLKKHVIYLENRIAYFEIILKDHEETIVGLVGEDAENEQILD